ncbi:hypothetical protein VNO77_06324 [Canavalia gladiata]|uniref:Uncharacterized protein n=1 Tax=Canavalia gladiata TaxID=3824 RepID=A0AAN9M6H7_CANGL
MESTHLSHGKKVETNNVEYRLEVIGRKLVMPNLANSLNISEEIDYRSRKKLTNHDSKWLHCIPRVCSCEF